MKKCIQTDKPLISIVLAIYNPNEEWLIELLKSLNEQDYENIEILAYDDCPEKPVSEKLLKENLTNFPYELFRGEKNKGSNFAFEFLTKKARGEYISYCDQDDVWEKNKLSMLIERFKNPNVVLAYSDLCIISGQGEVMHESFSVLSKRHKPLQGAGLFETLLVRNYVVGCSMIIKSSAAKKAVPFEKEFVHDHFLALFASLEGEFAYINKPLVKYRVHGNNQTGVLNGVASKKDYYEIRIEPFFIRTNDLFKRFKELSDLTCELLKWAEARKRYYLKPNIKDFFLILQYRRFGNSVAVFELILPFLPKGMFSYCIKLIKKGKI